MTKRRSGRQRFLTKHVHGRPVYGPVSQGLDQRLLVHQPTPCSVDQHGTGFHQCELLAVDGIPRLVCEREVQRNDICGSEEVIKRYQYDIQRFGALFTQERIVGHDVHAERARDSGHVPADAAEPEDSHCLATQLDTAERPSVPLSTTHAVDRPGNAANQPEKQRHGVFRRADGIRARCVEHRDSAVGRGGQIDVVDADTSPRNDAQIVRDLDHGGADPGIRTHQEAVRARQLRAELLAIAGRDDDLEFLTLLEHLQTGVGHLVSYQHDICHSETSSITLNSSSSRSTV